MAVQFILGRSGTGKTRYCINSIVDSLLETENQDTLVLLVPEQATYQAEHTIISDPRIEGYNRLHVLSFDRLQFMLNDKFMRHDLSQSGRRMVIHKLLLQNSDKLNIFNNISEFGGLADHLSRVIGELYQYDKDGEDIFRLQEILGRNGNIISSRKFADIAVIFNAYQDYMNQKDNPLSNSDYNLTEVTEKISKAGWLSGCRLWIDGFSGFTIQESNCLAQILKVSSEAHIALCLDPFDFDPDSKGAEESDPTCLFAESQHTYYMLIDIINKCKLEISKPVFLNRTMRFKKCRDLEHVEKYIFTSGPKTLNSTGGISIIPSQDCRSEAEYIARKINDLVTKHNYRYRDISIIASDLEMYIHYIRAAFCDMNIPFFIDKPKSLEHNPAIELIVSMLKIVSDGFMSPDIFAYIKTGLTGITRQDADILENYCLQFGIDKFKWHMDYWRYTGKNKQAYDEERINDIRDRITGPLKELYHRLFEEKESKNISGQEFCSIVWDSLCQLDLQRKLKTLSTNDDLDENRQMYDKLISLLDEYIIIFGNDLMTSNQHISVFVQCLCSIRLKQIPPMLDQVLVGSIERSRHPDLKAVFLLGATQKQFPVPVEFDCILNEEDRQLAMNENFILSDPLYQRLTNRQYLAYIAFTRPSEKLYITHPQVDEKGSEIMPSSFVIQLADLFNGKKIYETHDNHCSIDSSVGLIDLEHNLSSALSQHNPDTEQYYYISLLSKETDKSLSEIARRVNYSLSYNNESELDRETRNLIYGDDITCSSSRIGTFAKCPFMHFARYTLGLEKRVLFGFEPLDMGSYYHEMLDRLFRILLKENKTIADLEGEHISNYIDRIAEDIIETDSHINQYASAGGQNEFIIMQACEVIKDAVKQYAMISRAGSFRQAASEVIFGNKDNCLVLLLDDGRKVRIKGIIDRIDIADIEGRKVGLIFDYKKSEKTFYWQEAHYGLDLQLMIYMLALQHLNECAIKCDEVAGAFFIQIEVLPVEYNSLKSGFSRKASGVFNSRYAAQLDCGFDSGWNQYYGFYLKKDGSLGHYSKGTSVKPEHFDRMFEKTKNTICKLAESMSNGTISPRPYRIGKKSPCSYCDYQAVCRFDWQINHYNIIEPISKTQYLDTGDNQ